MVVVADERERLYSPSVTALSPIFSCSWTIFEISSSSILRRVVGSACSRRLAGRSKEPRCSALQGRGVEAMLFYPRYVSVRYEVCINEEYENKV